MGTVGIEGAAVLLRVWHNKVRKMISDGELRAAQFGRSYVILEKDVMDLIEKQVQSQTATRLGLLDYQVKRRPTRRSRS